jgi:hypothetical protein
MPSLFLSQTAKEGMSPWIQSRQKMTIRAILVITLNTL